MSLTFHILDAVAQDILLKETADTQEITFTGGEYDEDDAELQTRRRAGGPAAGAQALEGRKMTITLFGATAAGKPVRAAITGFEPFFFVRLPDGRLETQTAFEKKVRSDLAKRARKPVSVDITFTKRKVLFGYTGGRDFPFARLSVESLEAFRALKNIFLSKDSEPTFVLRAGTAPLEVCEANLDPMLRFFHLRNLQPCGWVTVAEEGDESDDGVIEVYADWTTVEPCLAPPAPTAPFLLASWDIEVYSENGEFPIPKRGYERAGALLVANFETAREAAAALQQALLYPDAPPKGMDPLRLRTGALPQRKALDAVLNDESFSQELDAVVAGAAALPKAQRDLRAKTAAELLARRLGKKFPLAGDPVIQIGVVLQRGGAGPQERHVFVLGSCDPVEGATVYSYKTEKELLVGWAATMRKWNPDILLGYNVFGFDERYVWERALELGLVHETKSETGWTTTECEEDFHALSRLWDREKSFALETKFLSSSALGDNTMYMWTAHGRLQVDLFHYIKRNFQLGAYKLDSVCEHFMSGKLGAVDTTDQGVWVLKTKATADVIPGRSVVLLDETGDGVVEKLKVVEVRKGEAVVVEAPQGDDAADLAIAAQTAVKWAVVKDDVSPQDIFKFHRGSAADRAVVAAYCIQDCVLVVDLYKKLEVFNNSMAMANACSVPIGYIFTRGQGIKIESLIFKECYERGQCIKVLPAPANRDGGAPEGGVEESYEGAIVLDPNPGFYFDSPIGVADFASLYPSTIISENISYDTLVWVKDFNMDGSFRCYALGDEADEAYAGPEVRWTEITFDIWGSDPEDKRKHPAKIKTGLRVCRYAQYPKEEKGTLPQILAKLLAQRKAKRKEGEKETDPFRKALLDAEQLAYKLTANSLYGQLGSATFKIRLQHLAASTTAYGRKQILFAKAAIEKFYGPGAGDPRCSASAAQVVYGDSVTGDTPLYLKPDNGSPYLQRVDELAGEWLPWHETKEVIDVSGQGLNTWTERGWTPIRRIIRHRLVPGKRLFRILTHTGLVDCTEDHSLVAASGVAIKPTDVKIGTELLHIHEISGQGWNQTTTCEITPKEAWAMGFFLADGSADVYDCPSGMKATWAVNKADTTLLNEVAAHLPFETKILDTIESSGVYKLVPVGGIKEQAVRYRALFYNSAREKRVPPAILNAPLEVAREFMKGFYAGDGDKANGFGYTRWDQKGKEISTGLYLLARRLGYSVSFNDRSDKLNVFRMTLTTGPQRKNQIAIKKIRELPTEGVDYVYDLETENHHFAVGPGALVVHNTDSLFVNFNVKDPDTGAPLAGRAALEATMHLTEEAGKFVSQALAAPHDFEYDKVFSPFIIFSKKRYVGNKYEDSPEHYSQTSMGIATKRRDYAPVVKLIYGGALRILLTDRDINAAIEFVQNKLTELVEGKMSMNLLTMSKSLRAEYKSETPPAHKILAERMAARDPGNAPVSGDRIPFIYVLPPPGQLAEKLQGNRIETPAYIRAKGMKPDYRFYVEHQLLNPITQLFALVAERIPGVQPPKNGWTAATPGERESATTEAIFRPIFALCDKIATARFGATMFGVVAQPTAAAPTKPRAKAAAAAAVAQPKVQANLGSYFVTKLLVKGLTPGRQTRNSKAAGKQTEV
jgi:DNA polymerase elongation subunit (family B)